MRRTNGKGKPNGKKLVTVKGPHVQVYNDKGGGYRFRRVAGNGEKTSASEGYASRQGARRAARQNHPNTPVLSIYK